MVELLLCKQGVAGSIPVASTTRGAPVGRAGGRGRSPRTSWISVHDGQGLRPRRALPTTPPPDGRARGGETCSLTSLGTWSPRCMNHRMSLEQRFSTSVVKLLRVSGGCFGVERRRRTWDGCAKLRGAANQALIRRCPNPETGRSTLRHPRLNP